MIIEAKGLTKSYGSIPVLKGIDLAVKKGEIVAIVGASGAGKSTLLHLLGTLDTPDSGSIHINEQEVELLRGDALARFRNKHIGFIFQFHQLLPEFSAIENVCMPAWLGGQSMQDSSRRGIELLDMLGIANRSSHKPSELSGGEQQRVAIARALMNMPDLILADEPSGNLDSENAGLLHKLLLDLRNELNQTFIIVTHNSELADLADRRVTMKDGRIIG
ncbi:MAG: Lipoprotein-releasing system ATP-binding protein LolD [Bacteroidota bacterium]|jgi:lipoprotein-releasing system ATP-binding protein